MGSFPEIRFFNGGWGGGVGDTVLHPGYVPDWQVDIHAVFY